MLNLVAGILTSRRGVIMLRTTCRTWHALQYDAAHIISTIFALCSTHSIYGVGSTRVR